ncbi:SEC-C motif-containing protein [Nocardioides albertanoniae]|uniref:SEC-C motif-containing protein n=1 Tax=Nocardioides albertanoniae TaxID=1175486 RepID=A0A543A0R5_9ACTN|nr:DUF5926 family protein [Nocardioides albertanoniae]TQL66187.1 SEC-C motif-containing protein [Nocardioides albertanoniae]
MAKKSRVKNRQAAAAPADGPNPRAACPCGSGKRYKACHGAAGGAFVGRPFEGLPGECDLVALRELVPSATVSLQVKGHESTPVTLGTLLPGAAPAMSRDSGEVWAGLQVQHNYGDVSRDVAAALLLALEARAAGESGIFGLTAAPGDGPRLQDLVADSELAVTVHEGFDWWIADVEDKADLEHALEHANESVLPTARLTSVEAAYWTSVGSKEHLRWVMPEPEDALLTALARLHVAGDDVIVPDARFVGMFRAHGLLAPVWDLPVGTGAEALEEPAVAFKKLLDDALADDSEITPEVRSARAGLANRQVTIR